MSSNSNSSSSILPPPIYSSSIDSPPTENISLISEKSEISLLNSLSPTAPVDESKSDLSPSSPIDESKIELSLINSHPGGISSTLINSSDSILPNNSINNSLNNSVNNSSIDINYSTLPSSLPCSICFDLISSSSYSSSFLCPSGELSHILCNSCFLDYFVHCCSSYSTLSSFPLKSSIPQCEMKIPEFLLFRLLGDSQELIEKYEKFSILAGLLDSTREKSNIPLTCKKCEKFTILLPVDYKKKANKLKEIMSREKREEEEKKVKMNDEINEIPVFLLRTNSVNRPIEEININLSGPEIEALGTTLEEQRQILNSFLPRAISLQSRSVPQNLSGPAPPPVSVIPPLLDRQPTQSEDSLTSLFVECETPNCGAATCLK